ncbi:hypothetical protein [Kistimonas asteriae]|uniref:hypothetical protein n=1 Tax=Kistimonas asteriae TaxID=517724 RepID=UPI001BA78A1D|nr:hypothetical protein [Kistimonas asteriae]
MWLLTSSGIISIVQHRENPNLMVVRASSEKALREFVPYAYSRTAKRKPVKRLPWRISLPRQTVRVLVHAQFNAVAYDNFPNTIRDDQYHNVFMELYRMTDALKAERKESVA